ncbi:NYN domain-containing protein [Thioclava sp. DLFJ4-1]|uniref:NYN domain-containing protein n=1 Tax=Thioclava sp. DLFJ4-1 TaxID=1915313 RepID=UPI000996D44C|nr:NYN domain-containing protein [Thioclava sp. DLFJ4-1]OOY17389.1 hypothetical protein BMI85_09360 [Thioclava sp. DLFJ4-1]
MNKPTALFIDGENISATFASQILKFAPGAFIRRAYGDVAQIRSWGDSPSIRLVHSGSGKNAGDVLLALDALELALERRAERFVIASSDGDFTHLATRLREKGMEVLGVGQEKAPKAFRESCSVFHLLKSKTTAAPARPPAVKKSASLDEKIRAAIEAHSKDGAGVPLAELATIMKKDHGVLIGNLPDKKWRPYFSNRPNLFALDPKGPKARVRCRPNGFSQLSAAAK